MSSKSLQVSDNKICNINTIVIQLTEKSEMAY